MELGISAAQAVSIIGRDVTFRADGRIEVYALSYARMLIPYLNGERAHLLGGMHLVHFRPGMKPWLSLSVLAEDEGDPLAGVIIYSGLNTYREMGLHLSHDQALELASALARPTWEELRAQRAS